MSMASRPVYLKLRDQIAAAIIEGRYPDGAMLPSVRAFAAEGAHVIFGTVFDDSMEDRLRVTVVATGLGAPRAMSSKPPMTIIRTGTDDVAMPAAATGT